MSSHQDSGNNQPPITTAEPHHQPPSSTTENLSGFTTLRIPMKTPSPTTTPPTQSSVETTTTTPESLLAAAIGRAIYNITTTNPLYRTLSDASVNKDSSITTTTTTPPPSKNYTTTIPTKNNPHFHNSVSKQPQKTRTNKPVRRALSDTAEYQQSKKTRTPPPPRISSSAGNPSPCLERMRKVEEMIREIEQRCSDIMRNNQDDNITNSKTPQQSQAMEEEEEEDGEREECVGVERAENGDIKFELNCSCGKHFEMLIKPNGYCFYRLT